MIKLKRGEQRLEIPDEKLDEYLRAKWEPDLKGVERCPCCGNQIGEIETKKRGRPRKEK